MPAISIRRLPTKTIHVYSQMGIVKHAMATGAWPSSMRMETGSAMRMKSRVVRIQRLATTTKMQPMMAAIASMRQRIAPFAQAKTMEPEPFSSSMQMAMEYVTLMKFWVVRTMQLATTTKTPPMMPATASSRPDVNPAQAPQMAQVRSSRMMTTAMAFAMQMKLKDVKTPPLAISTRMPPTVMGVASTRRDVKHARVPRTAPEPSSRMMTMAMAFAMPMKF